MEVEKQEKKRLFYTVTHKTLMILILSSFQHTILISLITTEYRMLKFYVHSLENSIIFT